VQRNLAAVNYSIRFIAIDQTGGATRAFSCRLRKTLLLNQKIFFSFYFCNFIVQLKEQQKVFIFQKNFSLKKKTFMLNFSSKISFCAPFFCMISEE
jgi:hypothetical protein